MLMTMSVRVFMLAETKHNYPYIRPIGRFSS